MEVGDIVEYRGPNSAWYGSLFEVMSEDFPEGGFIFRKFKHVKPTQTMLNLLIRVGDVTKLEPWKLVVITAADANKLADDLPDFGEPKKNGWEPDGFDVEAHRSFMKDLGG